MYVLFTYENLMALAYYNHLEVSTSKDSLLKNVREVSKVNVTSSLVISVPAICFLSKATAGHHPTSECKKLS